MIEKENLGNRYLNPNIEYIPLSGSKYFLKTFKRVSAKTDF